MNALDEKAAALREFISELAYADSPDGWGALSGEIGALVAVAREVERERCAALADRYASAAFEAARVEVIPEEVEHQREAANLARNIAAAIRAKASR